MAHKKFLKTFSSEYFVLPHGAMHVLSTLVKSENGERDTNKHSCPTRKDDSWGGIVREWSFNWNNTPAGTDKLDQRKMADGNLNR